MTKKRRTRKITLDEPIEIDGVEVSTMTMRKPKVKDILAVDNDSYSDAEKEITMFANLCEVAPESLYELDIDDYEKFQDEYKNFKSSAR